MKLTRLIVFSILIASSVQLTDGLLAAGNNSQIGNQKQEATEIRMLVGDPSNSKPPSFPTPDSKWEIRKSERPNIVFFFVDDMGWQDTSVPFHSETTQLNRVYNTPNMERLAAESLLFTNAYACSICSPSRISLMTGQNAARHKVTCWTLRKNKSPEQANAKLTPVDWPLNGLQPIGSGVEKSFESKTLPQILRNNGYRTIHAGKGHFGAMDTPGADPANLGFDVNIAGSYMGGPGSYHGDKNFSAVWRRGDKVWDVPGLEKYHGQKINLTEAITREVISEIEKSVAEENPFYLYLSHYAVHAPYEPDRRFHQKYVDAGLPKQQAIYASMLEGMDKSLGDVRQALKRLGIEKNTVVVFMSDNGSAGPNPRNLPLRGCKISGYEGGTRVPLIVNYPGITKPKQRSATPVIIEDIFPSFLEIAAESKTPKNDGLSFIPVLKDPTLDRSNRPLFWHYPNIYHLPPNSAVLLGSYKLIYWHVTQKLELFDLANDLGEQTDLSEQLPEKARELASLLTDHLKKTEALLPFDKASKEQIPFPLHHVK